MTLAGRTVLLTGATGGLGAAMARALAARGATLVLSGRRADALEAIAVETGGRPVVCDLAEPAAPESLAARGRRGRRPDRQRRAAGQRADRLLLRRGDRPRAGGQPARADGPGPAAGRGDGGPRRGPPGVHVVAVRQGGERRHVGLLGDEVRPARLRPRPAGGPRAGRRRRVVRLPGLRPRRGHVRRHGRVAAAVRRDEHRPAGRGRRAARDRGATAPRSTSRRSRCGPAPWRRCSAPAWRGGCSGGSAAPRCPPRSPTRSGTSAETAPSGGGRRRAARRTRRHAGGCPGRMRTTALLRFWRVRTTVASTPSERSSAVPGSLPSWAGGRPSAGLPVPVTCPPPNGSPNRSGIELAVRVDDPGRVELVAARRARPSRRPRRGRRAASSGSRSGRYSMPGYQPLASVNARCGRRAPNGCRPGRTGRRAGGEAGPERVAARSARTPTSIACWPGVEVVQQARGRPRRPRRAAAPARSGRRPAAACPSSRCSAGRRGWRRASLNEYAASRCQSSMPGALYGVRLTFHSPSTKKFVSYGVRRPSSKPSMLRHSAR